MAHTPIRPPVDPFLQPTKIEGAHGSMKAVMADPTTTTRSLADFGGNAEDAVLRCNWDKEAVLKILEVSP